MQKHYYLSGATSLPFLKHTNMSTKLPIPQLLNVSWSYLLIASYKILPTKVIARKQNGTLRPLKYHKLHRLSLLCSIYFFLVSSNSPFNIQPRHPPLYPRLLYFINCTNPSSIMRFRFLKQKSSFVLPPSHILHPFL